MKALGKWEKKKENERYFHFSNVKGVPFTEYIVQRREIYKSSCLNPNHFDPIEEE